MFSLKTLMEQPTLRLAQLMKETKTITVAIICSERDIVIYRSDAGTGDATSGSDYTAITAFSKLTTISGTAGGIGLYEVI